ncbi:hypothetical protein COOONC_18268, partial [Cooperia oncophora]
MQDFSRSNKAPRYQRSTTRPIPSSESESIGRMTPSQHSLRSEESQVQSSTYYGTEGTGDRTSSYSNGSESTEKLIGPSLDEIYS